MTTLDPARDRLGDWLQTQSGRRFYPKDPLPDDVHGEDVAHALSMLCRYGGHIDTFYSVAEHCVLMSYAVPPDDALAALLHDATEAYVVDVPRPVKRYLPEYRALEQMVWWAIAVRYHLELALPASVLAADDRIILTERNALMRNAERTWWQDTAGVVPLEVKIAGWIPAEAKRRYFDRLTELLAARPAR